MAVFPRKNNQGKIVGYYAVINYVDANGNRRQRKRSARTRDDAKTLEAELVTKRAKEGGASLTPAKETVRSYLDHWLEGVQVAPSTKTRYESLIAHVSREVGDTPLQKLTPMQVQGVYVKMRERGLSAKTALNVHRVLRMALTDAVETFHLIPENPASKKLAPRAATYEPHPPTPEQTRRIIEAAASTPLAALVAVAAYTGARQGELLSLRWEDVDLDGAALSVRKSKTKSGHRRIPLTPATVDLLRQHRKRQNEQRLLLGPAWTDSGLVFTSAIGTPIDDSNLRRSWTTICRNAGVKVRFHDLRHGFATFLLSQNVHPKIVSSLLGHSRITITLDTYSHVIPALGLEAQAIAGLDAALSP